MINRLKELEGRATRGPWYAIPNPDWAGSNYRIGNKADAPWANFGQIAYMGKNDAGLIVAARNALPSLLKVAEAAKVAKGFYEEMIAALGPCDHDVNICNCGVEADYQKLCKALDELEAKND